MDKPGRNDPCPCGSGKKYKKCCLPKDADDDAALAEREELSDEAIALDMHDYALTGTDADPMLDIAGQPAKPDRSAPREEWSMARLALMDTDEIVAQLAALKIDGTLSAFLALTQGHFSAWSIGTAWSDGLQPPHPKNAADFVCLAACELWKRYCPERPSTEMVDEWVCEGYDAVEARKHGAAVEIWLRVWETVRLRLPPNTSTFEQADAVFKITHLFGNWIQDFAMAIRNAAVKDAKYADVGVRLAREVLERFVDEHADTILNFRCDLGRFLFAAGKLHEGEETLQAVMRDYPDRACGYVSLSDELSYGTRGHTDYPRSIALLEQALSLPVVDAENWDVEARLGDLRESMNQK